MLELVLGRLNAEFEQAKENKSYAEVGGALKALRSDLTAILNILINEAGASISGFPILQSLSTESGDANPFTTQTAVQIINDVIPQISKALDQKKQQAVDKKLQDGMKIALGSLGYACALEAQYSTSVNAAFAGVVISFEQLPAKINPIARSVTQSIRSENEAALQKRTAKAFARLVDLCNRSDMAASKTNVNDKLIKNLCGMLCSNTRVTLLVSENTEADGIIIPKTSKVGKESQNEVLFLDTQSAKDLVKQVGSSDETPEELKQAMLIRRGAEFGLVELCKLFGKDLFTKVPQLWRSTFDAVNGVFAEQTRDGRSGIGQEFIIQN